MNKNPFLINLKDQFSFLIFIEYIVIQFICYKILIPLNTKISFIVKLKSLSEFRNTFIKPKFQVNNLIIGARFLNNITGSYEREKYAQDLSSKSQNLNPNK